MGYRVKWRAWSRHVGSPIQLSAVLSNESIKRSDERRCRTTFVEPHQALDVPWNGAFRLRAILGENFTGRVAVRSRNNQSEKKHLINLESPASLVDHLVGLGEQRRGTARPSALAVLRLMTSSNLVGCWTGRSAGLAPLRIFPA